MCLMGYRQAKIRFPGSFVSRSLSFSLVRLVLISSIDSVMLNLQRNAGTRSPKTKKRHGRSKRNTKRPNTRRNTQATSTALTTRKQTTPTPAPTLTLTPTVLPRPPTTTTTAPAPATEANHHRPKRRNHPVRALLFKRKNANVRIRSRVCSFKASRARLWLLSRRRRV